MKNENGFKKLLDIPDNPFGEVIYSYTRKQAIEDGFLIDVSELAKEAGFKFPAAITRGIYSILNDTHGPGQSFEGRARDMFTIFKLEIKRSEPGQDTIYFAPLFQGQGRGAPRPVKMWSKCGPGDNAEPVLIIMLEGED